MYLILLPCGEYEQNGRSEGFFFRATGRSRPQEEG